MVLHNHDHNLISIHSTARVETKVQKVQVDHSKISIHSTARVETHYRLHMHLHISFQSTPPRGWRHGIRMPKPRFCTFQSTPPRGWRQGTVWIAVRAYDISIHSTARVETHTLWLPVLGQYDFNPLHREGGDTKRVRENQRARISIHSTARVETAAAAISFCSSADFNPLHREGGDPCWRP